MTVFKRKEGLGRGPWQGAMMRRLGLLFRVIAYMQPSRGETATASSGRSDHREVRPHEAKGAGTMRKLVVLAFLAAVVAAIAAASASAKTPGTNGLLSFTRFEPALQQDVVYTINPDGSGERRLLVGGESGHWSPDGSRILVGPDCCA